jgi:hypothetical protein
MINISDIQTGDSFLVRNRKDWLSNIICAVMKKWGKKKGYNVDLLFSHAARFVWIADELYLFGSIDVGYRPILFRLHYNWENDEFVIMRRKTELTEKEKKQTTNYCLHLTTISLMYQYWNFIQWLMLVYLGINTFGGKGDRANYCYESEDKCRKDLNPEWYGDISEVSIFNLLYDKNYSIIYKSK